MADKASALAIRSIPAMTPEKAIGAFARAEFTAAARRLAFKLRRMPATDIYGDDYAFRHLWDEFCYEAHHGPTPMLEAAWEITLVPFLNEAVDRMPRHTAQLLTWYLASFEEDEPNNAICRVSLAQAILNAARILAREVEVCGAACKIDPHSGVIGV